jgi:hypothetical protein
MARLRFINDQIREIEAARLERLVQQPDKGGHPMVLLLARVIGVGIETAEHAGSGGSFAQVARPPGGGPLWRTDRIARGERHATARERAGQGRKCPRAPRHAAAAITMAIQRRRPGPGLIHHSDRASQYAAGDYRDIL